LEEFKDEPVQVLEPEVAREISNILSDNAARTPVFGARSALYFSDRPMAAKTGTTNEFRDGWTVGYTPSLAVGVWAGNNDNTPMRQEPGVYVAAPIWHEFFEEAFKKLNLAPESFTPPSPRTSDKPILNGEYVINGQIHSTLYYIDRDNPQGPVPSNPAADPQFNNWEAGVKNWLSSAAINIQPSKNQVQGTSGG
jgi:membrane peptidoglycan carboxypeptidase